MTRKLVCRMALVGLIVVGLLASCSRERLGLRSKSVKLPGSEVSEKLTGTTTHEVGQNGVAGLVECPLEGVLAEVAAVAGSEQEQALARLMESDTPATSCTDRLRLLALSLDRRVSLATARKVLGQLAQNPNAPNAPVPECMAVVSHRALLVEWVALREEVGEQREKEVVIRAQYDRRIEKLQAQVHSLEDQIEKIKDIERILEKR